MHSMSLKDTSCRTCLTSCTANGSGLLFAALGERLDEAVRHDRMPSRGCLAPALLQANRLGGAGEAPVGPSIQTASGKKNKSFLFTSEKERFPYSG